MPQITQFTRTVLPRQLLSSQATARSFGGGKAVGAASNFVVQSGARATQQAIKSFGQVAGAMQEIQVRQDQSDYYNKLSQFKLDNLRRSEELRVAEFEPEQDLAEAYIADLQQRASGIEIPASQQARWKKELDQMQLSAGQAGIREQARRQGVKTRNDFDNTVVNANAIVSQNPDGYLDAVDIIKNQISVMPLAPEDRKELLDESLGKVNSTRASAIIANNPFQFKQLVSEGQFNDLPNLNKYIQSADGAIKRIQKENSEAIETSQLLFNASQGSAYLDPSNSKHKKALDMHYSNFTMPDGSGINQGVSQMNPNSAEMALRFSEKFKVIPESLQSTARGMMNGGNQQERQFAYDLVNELKASGATGFTNKESADANTYAGLISSGYNANEAINIVDSISSPDFEKIRKVRQELIKDFKSELKPNALESELEDFYQTAFFFEPDISQEMLTDYENVIREEFLRTNKIDSAKESARQIVNRKYGVSDLVGASDIAMAYPPERYGHPSLTIDENRKWMKASLKKDLKSLNLSDDLQSYQLFSIDENRDRVNAGQNPLYYVIDENNDFVRGKDNMPLLWEVDPSIGASIISRREEAKKEKIFSRAARAKRIRDLQIDPSADDVIKFLGKTVGAAISAGEGLRELFSDEESFEVE